MPESFEKRQRDRRKKLKRQQKRERKAQRKAAKNRGPLHHTLHRGRDEHRFETDIWLGMLDIVATSGWTPPEPDSPDEPAGAPFARPDGLELSDEVALELALAIESLLDTISDEELPIGDFPFGERHTEKNLTRRAAGEKLDLEDSAAAYELLSGPAKREIERLAEFLKEGGASIVAD